nr:hypothetical protein [Candidatus Sigynarchaeum springense]
MVMATQKQEEPAIRVDQGRKYPTSAGVCDKCGYYKTWAFKILNPKTGKQVPGHVTKEGFKINDGDCPFYALLKQKAAAKADPAPQEAPQDQGTTREPLDLEAQAPAPAPVQAPKRAADKPGSVASDQRFALTVEIQEDEIVAKVGPCAAKLTKAEAATLAKVLVDMIAA